VSVIKILIGLFGLGILILAHEWGHYLVARRMGVIVQKFSIGFGKTLLSFKKGDTEYAISMIPLGGYCKFYGEQNFIQAIEKKMDRIPRENGSLYSCPPWQRILIAFAGPAANFILSLFLLFLAAWIVYPVQTLEPRIVLVSDYQDGKQWPADKAGLQTGDLILEVDGKVMETFQDLNRTLLMSPEENLDVKILRRGVEKNLTLRPDLNKETGGGVIGVYPFMETVLKEDFIYDEQVLIPSGSRILRFNNTSLKYISDMYPLLRDGPSDINLLYKDPDGFEYTLAFPGSSEDFWTALPLPYENSYSRKKSFIEGVSWVFSQYADFFNLTFKTFGILIKGVNPVNALAGPIRAPMITGEIAVQGFNQGLGSGFYHIFLFLAPLGIGLGIINLLPIPALDGGQIILFLIDWIKRKKLSPQFVFRYQVIGSVMVLLLVFLSFSVDILYFFQR